ncbi:MAG TPA: hypothetical protein VN873_16325 [Candidatus Angelobacter sp.]|nr:hypothetical protein [Candidatus Angelobacter sp.]
MSQNSVSERQWFWTFILVDQSPGPSLGDAIDLINELGFDSREFRAVEMIDDMHKVDRHITEFSVTGSLVLLRSLQAAYDRAAHFPTDSPELVPSSVDEIAGEPLPSARNAIVELPPWATSVRALLTGQET